MSASGCINSTAYATGDFGHRHGLYLCDAYRARGNCSPANAVLGAALAHSVGRRAYFHPQDLHDVDAVMRHSGLTTSALHNAADLPALAHLAEDKGALRVSVLATQI